MTEEKGLLPYTLLMNVVYFFIFWGIHQLCSSKLDVLNIAYANALLWVILVVIIQLTVFFYKIIKVTEQDEVSIILNLFIVSVIVLVSSFFLAWQTLESFKEVALWQQRLLHFFGFIYAYIVFAVVTSFYTGKIYKIVGLIMTLVSYVIFAFFSSLIPLLV